MNFTIDDADSPVMYSASPAWNKGIWPQQDPQPLFNSNHGTPNPGAQMTLSFTGTAVYVYGFKASDHGYRDVWIDGGLPVRCDGRLGHQGSRALVYWAEGLSPGPHNITLQHAGEQGQYLNIDYFVVNTAPNDQSSPLGIIAGVVAGVAFLSLAAIIWVLWLYRRMLRRQRSEKAGEKSQDEEWKPTPTSDAIPAAPTLHTIHPFYASPNPNTPATLVNQARPDLPSHFSAKANLLFKQSPSSSPTPTRFTSISASSSTTALLSPGMTGISLPSTPRRSDTTDTLSNSAETIGSTNDRRSKGIGLSTRIHPSTDVQGIPSSSHPQPPIIIEDSIPPPRYEQ